MKSVKVFILAPIRPAAGRHGAELAFDEPWQRAVVIVAAGGEVIEAVAQEARERTRLRVARCIGPRSAEARARRLGLTKAGCLEVAHARRVGTLVKAEVVETAAERDCLQTLGCDLFQGFLFARPGPAFPPGRGAEQRFVLDRPGELGYRHP